MVATFWDVDCGKLIIKSQLTKQETLTVKGIWFDGFINPVEEISL